MGISPCGHCANGTGTTGWDVDDDGGVLSRGLDAARAKGDAENALAGGDEGVFEIERAGDGTGDGDVA